MNRLLSARVLLLNASYEPIKIVNWQKAVIYWFQGKVEILEYHSVFAHSVRSSFQLPSVLRLKSYVKQKNAGMIRFSRENVYLRDNYTCQYCGTQLSGKHLTLDHVIPASHQGKKNWTNVVSACRCCNQKKGNRTPQSANMPLLSEPKMPTWMPILLFEIREHSIPASWAPYLNFELETG